MAAATLPAPILGVLATFILDDLSITRGELGLAITVNTLVAAVLSPPVGRFTDRIGGRLGLVAVFTLAAVGLGVISLGPGYAGLMVGAGITAVSQAFGNPATNKLIASRVAAARRGFITGLKQSGVQVGVFAAGLALPAGATAFGWRATVAVVAGLGAAGAGVAWLMPRDRIDEGRGRSGHDGYPVAIWWLAGYGALLGFGGAAVFFFALFVEEALGGSASHGGAVVAASGIAAVVARIALARIAERYRAFPATLAGIAAAGIAAIGLFAASTTYHWAVWPGAVLYGLSVASWNSVGMLAVISVAGHLDAGGASGIVMLGFLGGFGLAPPIYGRSVDATGEYTLVWLLAGVALAAALVVIGASRRAIGVPEVADSAT